MVASVARNGETPRFAISHPLMSPTSAENRIAATKITGIMSLELARKAVRYARISLLKPTLEDYFIKLARRRNENVGGEERSTASSTPLGANERGSGS